MADDPRAENFEENARNPRDDAHRLPTADAADGAPPRSSPGERADLDMGGGGPTGATGSGTTHQSDLDMGSADTISGALDDLPDMTGADAVDVDSSPLPGNGGSGDANRDRNRFDASAAYTGDDDTP